MAVIAAAITFVIVFWTVFELGLPWIEKAPHAIRQ
jgi:hypothetical protein